MLGETGRVEHCQIEGTLPMFGNNDKSVDPTASSAAAAIAPPSRQLDAIHREATERLGRRLGRASDEELARVLEGLLEIVG